MCFFPRWVIRKNICYCLLFDLSLLKILPLVILPLFEIMLYMVKTLKMGFFKKGWRDFFLFLDLRSTQTNTNNGQTSFPCTFFVSKPQSKIGVDGKFGIGSSKNMSMINIKVGPKLD